MHVLIVDPLPRVADAVEHLLDEAGQEVLRCLDEKALQSVRLYAPDVVLLDPTRAPSWRAARAIRRAGHDVGLVLIASEAWSTPEAVERWLDEADDCLVASADPRVIVAHCGAVERRRFGHVSARMEVRGLSYDARTGDTLAHGSRLTIPPAPCRALLLLMRRAGAVVGREALLAAACGADSDAPDKHLDVTVCVLRRALRRAGLSEGLIETVPDRGYILRRAPVPAADPTRSAHRVAA